MLLLSLSVLCKSQACCYFQSRVVLCRFFRRAITFIICAVYVSGMLLLSLYVLCRCQACCYYHYLCCVGLRHVSLSVLCMYQACCYFHYLCCVCLRHVVTFIICAVYVSGMLLLSLSVLCMS